MWFLGLADTQKRWLINMGITHVAAVSNTIVVPLHFVICYVFVVVLDWGIKGLGWANLVTGILATLTIVVHTSLLPNIQEAVFFP